MMAKIAQPRVAVPLVPLVLFPLPPVPFFCKYVILRGFKSVVLEICDSKGFADAFLQIYVIRKELEAKSGQSMAES